MSIEREEIAHNKNPHFQGGISERSFRSVLREFLGYELNEHEIITLTRRFRNRDLRYLQRLSLQVLFSLLQSEMKLVQKRNLKSEYQLTQT